MKQNLPHGVSNVVSNCDDGSNGSVQNPELASILDTCLKPFTLLMMSTNLLALWMLCHSTKLRVLGSNHTRSLLFGLMTITRAWTQSLALLISNFLMTPQVSTFYLVLPLVWVELHGEHDMVNIQLV